MGNKPISRLPHQSEILFFTVGVFFFFQFEHETDLYNSYFISRRGIMSTLFLVMCIFVIAAIAKPTGLHAKTDLRQMDMFDNNVWTGEGSMDPITGKEDGGWGLGMGAEWDYDGMFEGMDDDDDDDEEDDADEEEDDVDEEEDNADEEEDNADEEEDNADEKEDNADEE